MQISKTYTTLAMAGTLPFIAAALLPLLGHDALPHLGPLDQLVSSYGLAIVCFLAGTHWGTCLAGRGPASPTLLMISNVIFLAVWFAYIGAGTKTALGVQAGAFLVLLIVDLRLRKMDVLSAAYSRVRIAATLIAVLSLLVVLLQ